MSQEQQPEQSNGRIRTPFDQVMATRKREANKAEIAEKRRGKVGNFIGSATVRDSLLERRVLR